MKRIPSAKGEQPLAPLHLRRMLICIVLPLFLLVACSNPKPKVYRVGVVCGADLFLPILDGLKTKLTELGFEEGRNISFDIHAFNDDSEGEFRAAKKLVADNVDLIITMPTQPSVMAHQAIQGTDIPLVFTYAGIEATGLVESVTHPGGNTTGVRFPGPEQICRRLEVLQLILPKISRVVVCYDRNYPTASPSLQALRLLARDIGVELVEVPVSSLAEMETKFEKLAQQPVSDKDRLDGILLMPDTLNHSRDGWDAIRLFAQKIHIPIAGSFVYTAEQGALFCTGNEMTVIGALTAPLVAKVLRGTPAGSLPVVSPEQGLVVNLGVARELGISVPEEVLNMANRIIR